MDFTHYIAEAMNPLMADIAALCRINSVQGEAQPGKPFGEGPAAALEAALKMKDATGCKVIVVTMGPPPAAGCSSGTEEPDPFDREEAGAQAVSSSARTRNQAARRDNGVCMAKTPFEWDLLSGFVYYSRAPKKSKEDLEASARPRRRLFRKGMDNL